MLQGWPIFAEIYSIAGCLSIPSERLDTDLLIRWFSDMNLDELCFEHSTFSQNSERLLAHAVVCGFSTRS